MSDGGELLRPAPAPTWRDRVAWARAFVVERPAVVGASTLALVAIAVAGFLALRPPAVATPPPEVLLPRADVAAAPSSTVVPAVVVHVAGAVARPGLVRLPGGSRVADAIEAAGGLRGDADLDRLNLAAPLADGQRVWVPVVGQQEPVATTGGAGGGGGEAPAVVDLNTATLADLESLPGVGPATAQAILDHRTRVGRFRSVDDLLDVRGIGPAKLAALRDRVRV